MLTNVKRVCINIYKFDCPRCQKLINVDLSAEIRIKSLNVGEMMANIPPEKILPGITCTPCMRPREGTGRQHVREQAEVAAAEHLPHLGHRRDLGGARRKLYLQISNPCIVIVRCELIVWPNLSSNFSDIKKCCVHSMYLQKSVPIQPKTN